MYSYSSRLSWSFSPNAITTKIAQRRAEGAEIIDLTRSNPTDALLAYPHDQIKEAFSQIPDFRYSANPFGMVEAREAIAAYYQRRSIVVALDQILLTASTSEAYSLLFKLFCNPREEVLVPVPSYPLFEYLAALEGALAVPYQLRYDGTWFIDFDHLRGQVSPKTRAIVVVNPNNPTGSFLKGREAEILYSVGEQHGLPLIVDEVFQDYAVSEHPGRVQTFIGSDRALSFSLSGLSKAAGMPQMKAGWIVINGPVALRAVVRERLEVILDTYLSVNTPVQKSMGPLLTIGERIQKDLQLRVRTNYSELQAVLAGSPAHSLHLEGGWSAILRVPQVRTEEAWVSRLVDEHGVIVQPGYFFDMPAEAYLVVSLLTPPDEFRRGLVRVRDAQRNP